VIQTLTRNWLLLGFCGVLEAMIAVVYLIMMGANGRSTVTLLGELTLAAGACAIATGLWRSAEGKCWLLVLNGLALVALGLIYYAFVRYSISFLTIALLIILTAASIGSLELVTARSLRRVRHAVDGWLLDLAGVISVGFALAFLLFGFGWVNPGMESHRELVWMGVYFGFSAICMLGLALRLPRQAY